ncbi:unnamed protein product [Mytilus edulis]|uniref:Uncharacterized protein n=1 Tax=Mytilus edulis TaxID=6550 RepID=A0A8S3RDW4_MYTED|nr:unnamed protein product [Mytilus edulis]
MFVITEDAIKENAENRYECFGIVIPDDLLFEYIRILFDGLTKADSLKNTIDDTRCFMNSTFRVAFKTFTTQLTRGKIGNLIQTGSTDFANRIFVLTEDDIQDKTENRYERVGIVITDNLLGQYIHRWFDDLTKSYRVEDAVDENRLLMNTTCRIALRTYMRQLTKEKSVQSFRLQQVSFSTQCLS